MNYLLDVNVLVAWGWSDHVDHDRAARWIGATMRRRSDWILTSAIPQLGFVRFSVQRSNNEVTPEIAGETLGGMLRLLVPRHRFLPDDQEAIVWPPWCRSASRTTDVHLLSVAQAHNALLATLDSGIPGAFLIS
ncbi:MAG: type II toxin-antitoxin system VapC family toxin [Pedosphaera sp.]|nr:type II toxin-antitoxin system VapC family toxin [Pedosphaera sp.]